MMFEIKNVSKRYNGELVLNDISLKINKGFHFIVGASGSGKTTLLKIMSGMEHDFEGEVVYCDQDIKSLSASEKSYFYNNIFGFVWQDFNLLDDSTVLENVLLPQYLKNNQSYKNAEKILKDLKIFDIAMQKVKYLSGGQKQRVAIARELMKNPQVIIADEPTSALDKKSSKIIMNILRLISKNRTVIVVTHDTSLIMENDHIYELDKGELVKKAEVSSDTNMKLKMQNTHKLSLVNAFKITKSNIKNKPGRFIISILSLIIASLLLLTTVGGTINSTSQKEFDNLMTTYGESLCDLSVVNSFIDASGTGGNDKDKPNGDVTQDIGGLYDLYAMDERVSFVAYLQAFDNITITFEGKEYQIKSSGSTPLINEMVTGKMPMGEKNEVVVPESFVKSLGISPEEAIGKEIDFNGSIYNWNTGEAVPKNVDSKAKIVGVMDTTAKYDYQGEIMTYTVDDSFFFSKVALDKMLKQADNASNKINFMIRAKTPADMIAIKDELSQKGIVPLGRFELVEDVVRLNNQTTEQSGSASMLITVLSFVMIVSIFIITGVMRKKEIAIYRVGGFKTSHLLLINLTETLAYALAAVVLMFVTAPLSNLIIKSIFGVSILNVRMLFIGILFIILNSVLAYFSTAICWAKVDINIALKSGDKQ